MPGCVFHARGETFDADAFLAGSGLKPYQVWHKGEGAKRGKPLKRIPSIREDSGFSIEVSRADGDLSVECLDAIRFLRVHSAAMTRLASFPGAEDRRLDFGYYRRDCAVQFDYLPPELLALAGSAGVGIELSLYPATA